jgi:hypothetical protein
MAGMSHLPAPRGALTEALFAALTTAPGSLPTIDVAAPGDPLADDDLHLALYVLYELHYRGFDGVADRWEWDPAALALRAGLEGAFEAGLDEALAGWTPPAAEARTMDLALRAIIDADDGPSLARHLEIAGSLEQFHEFVIHRSAYQLKEADPHSWALPRLWGAPKAAMERCRPTSTAAATRAASTPSSSPTPWTRWAWTAPTAPTSTCCRA